MEIQLKRGSSTPLYRQLRNNIRDQILSGRLADGFKLPSERQLVEKLQVHRNTVKKAYEMLIQEGLVYASSKAPRGYFVKNSPAEAKPDPVPETRRTFSSLDKNFNYHSLGCRTRSSGCTIPPIFPMGSLLPGFLPTERHFPLYTFMKSWKRSFPMVHWSLSGFVIPKARNGCGAAWPTCSLGEIFTCSRRIYRS